MTEQPQGWKHTLDEWRKVAQGVSAVAVLLGMMWATFGPVGQWAWAFSKQWPVLLKDVADLKGENRVIRQLEGMSYVEKPAHIGEQIRLILHIGRTEVGAACQAVTKTPIYTDSAGAMRSADTSAMQNILTRDISRIMLMIDLPEGIPSGITTLRVKLEYNCGGKPVYELTDAVIFEVLPRRGMR